MSSTQFLSILNTLVHKDRSMQYWNAENTQSRAAAGAELLKEITKLDVIQDTLKLEGNESMELTWDNFDNKMKTALISLLKKVQNERNRIVADIDSDTSDEFIDENLNQSLVNSFEIVPALSDNFDIPSHIRGDANMISVQREDYISLLVSISKAEYRASTGRVITASSKKYAAEALKSKANKDDDTLLKI